MAFLFHMTINAFYFPVISKLRRYFFLPSSWVQRDFELFPYFFYFICLIKWYKWFISYVPQSATATAAYGYTTFSLTDTQSVANCSFVLQVHLKVCLSVYVILISVFYFTTVE